MPKATQHTLTGAQAKTWTMLAQVSSGVIVLAAVAVGLVGLPHPKTPSSVQPTEMTFPAGMPGADHNTHNSNDHASDSAQDESQQRASIDTIGLAMRLSLLDNAPELKEADDKDLETQVIIDPQPTTVEEDDSSIRDRVRYVGFIKDPVTNHAFIRIDGKQRVVSVGGVAKTGDEDLPDLQVERITPRAITLSNGEYRSVIKIGTKSGQSITMIGGAKVDVAAVAETGSLLTAEDEARIAAMPPRQQPLARRRLERERRGLPPDKERRRNPQPQVTVKASFNDKKPQQED